jgi:hypothetical protein
VKTFRTRRACVNMDSREVRLRLSSSGGWGSAIALSRDELAAVSQSDGSIAL